MTWECLGLYINPIKPSASLPNLVRLPVSIILLHSIFKDNRLEIFKLRLDNFQT
jgi:hypothetical protein